MPYGANPEFAKKLFSPKVQKPAPPATMPDPEDPEAIEARRRAQAQLLAASGRGSTRLAGGSGSGGGRSGDYSRGSI